MRLANLFIIGAMKSGTTSLHAYLSKHPQIAMSEPKEPAYFLEPADRHPIFKSANGEANDTPAAYLRIFGDLESKVYAGDASTQYTSMPHHRGVPGRIYDYNPEARLIYLIRDPIERTISHYWWNVRKENECRDIVAAIQNDDSYRNLSHYAMQLEPYRQLFGDSRIKVLTLEELSSRPERCLQDIFDWLGLRRFCPSNMGDAENQAPPLIVQPKFPLLDRFRFSRFWETASSLVPKPCRTLARSLTERRIEWKKVEYTEVANYLRPIQQKQTNELKTMLNREFPQWRTLYREAPAGLKL